MDHGDWRFSTVFRTEREAQLFARRSWAPAGVVLIVDRGPEHLWRYEVWFGYPEGRGRSKKFRTGGNRKSQAQVRGQNYRRIEQTYKQKSA